MKFYRRIFFAGYRWYRDHRGPESSPAIWTAGILFTFHVINLFTVILALSSRDVRLSPIMRRITIPMVVLFCIYGWVLDSRIEKIEQEFEDEDFRVTGRAGTTFVLYCVGSVLALVLVLALK